MDLTWDTTAVRTLRDDLESALHVLLWTALSFAKSSLSSFDRVFMKKTFEPDKRTSTEEDPDWRKRSIFVSDTLELKREGGIFLNCQVLDKLVQDLVELLKYRYIELPRDLLELYAEYRDSPIDAVQEVLKTCSPYKQEQALKMVENHEAVIGIFAKHLASGSWPVDDAAMRQSFAKSTEAIHSIPEST